MFYDQVELAGMYSMPHLHCSPRHIRGSSAISLARYRVDHLHTKPLSASRPSVFSKSLYVAISMVLVDFGAARFTPDKYLIE